MLNNRSRNYQNRSKMLNYRGSGASKKLVNICACCLEILVYEEIGTGLRRVKLL